MPTLQRAIGNHAVFRLLSQRQSVTESTPKQKADRGRIAGAEAAPSLAWDFSKIAVFAPDRAGRPQTSSPFLQPKLMVGQVNDPLEHEADRVADQVMRMHAPQFTIGPTPPQISRKCADCEDEEKKPIQSKPAPSAHTGAALNADAAMRAAERGGAPLSREAQSYFEPRYRYDFSRVRVHADAEAGDAARVVRARAYTIGRDIVFGTGEYAPATVKGKRLLAHELVHVVQQTSGAWTQSAPAAHSAPNRRTHERKMRSEPEVQRKEDYKPDAGEVESPREETLEEGKTEELKEKMTNCASDYLVESWEGDTCCSNRGFPDPAAKRKGEDCCNKFPEFVDNEAAKRGFDGAASCKSIYRTHRATVTPKGKSKSVEVICADTRATNDRIIELGQNAAQKAYGNTILKEPDAKVCYSHGTEAGTCSFETPCKAHPTEAECMPAGCSKTDGAGSSEKQAEPKK
jgi:hypothetical protein